MKSMKFFYIGLIIGLIGMVVGFCYGTFFQPSKIRKKVEELYLNGKFAISTVLGGNYAVYGEATTQLSSIGYRFEISTGKHYGAINSLIAKQTSKATYSAFCRYSTVVKKGDRFLVLYDKNDPKNAILLLDHPITSDLDFERYKTEIEELRKDPKWRGYK